MGARSAPHASDPSALPQTFATNSSHFHRHPVAVIYESNAYATALADAFVENAGANVKYITSFASGSGVLTYDTGTAYLASCLNYACAHAPTQPHTNAQANTHTHACAHTYTRACMHKQTQTRTQHPAKSIMKTALGQTSGYLKIVVIFAQGSQEASGDSDLDLLFNASRSLGFAGDEYGKTWDQPTRLHHNRPNH